MNPGGNLQVLLHAIAPELPGDCVREGIAVAMGRALSRLAELRRERDAAIERCDTLAEMLEYANEVIATYERGDKP